MEFYIVPGAIFLDDLPGYHADSPLDQFVSQRSRVCIIVGVIVVILSAPASSYASFLASGNSRRVSARDTTDTTRSTLSLSPSLNPLFLSLDNLDSVRRTRRITRGLFNYSEARGTRRRDIKDAYDIVPPFAFSSRRKPLFQLGLAVGAAAF